MRAVGIRSGTFFRPSWISRALLMAEMIRPNDPELVICPVAALTRPAGDGDRIQVANRVRKMHLIESIKELRAELDVLPLPNVELLTDAEVDIGLSRPRARRCGGKPPDFPDRL